MLATRDPEAGSVKTRGSMNRPAAALLMASAAWFGTACVVIEDGEVGLLKSFGSIRDEPLLPGVVFLVPVAREVEVWNVKLQELKEAAQVPTSEGLIVGLETSLLFRVVPHEAPALRKTVGWDYLNPLVIPYFRNALRDVVSGVPVRNVFREQGRKEIAAKIREFRRAQLEPRGIEVADVLLRDVKLPARFKESIEAKLTAEQRVQQKQFELEQARKDAEIEVARAEGAARAQAIVRATLSDSYLRYLWIKTLNKNPNVIYVSTEANLPIVRPVAGK
jgi:regulator of protease activity HflC (stomatin/prohibitin superfamily)